MLMLPKRWMHVLVDLWPVDLLANLPKWEVRQVSASIETG